MAERHVTFALRDKYARLIGEAEHHEREAERLRDLAGHVEIAAKLFDDGLDLSDTRPIQPRSYNRWKQRGIGLRVFLTVLREAGRPLTSLEIAERALAFDPHAESDKAAVKALVGPINKALAKRDGEVVVIEGRPRRWEVAR
ncbi:hypothetical protein SLG_06690 [Sphingobium sp. SYK-6]|uniref:hypothetical protein n=1 Tax=Sphingobium sp. (strain NBRC 103272 / SYK-6) TaxID=627192 RepID=UPI0002276918|nr:hypothetical protein [Sphingobium sp. SYK-6]BAK65344.1 hypothetical protein SLG_06690 [Sphingobium sp. SYK-6]